MVGKGGQVALPETGNTANPMVCCRIGRVQAAVLAGTTQTAGTTSVLGSWSWRQWKPVRSASKKGASGDVSYGRGMSGGRESVLVLSREVDDVECGSGGDNAGSETQGERK
jgi:hypothetical protein